MRFINAIYLDIDVIPTGVATSQLRPPLCSRAINQRASVALSVRSRNSDVMEVNYLNSSNDSDPSRSLWARVSSQD